MTLKAYDTRTGNEVPVGSKLFDFRGDLHTLTKLTRAAVPGKSGMVVVTDSWHFDHEYYDKVLNLEVREV